MVKCSRYCIVVVNGKGRIEGVLVAHTVFNAATGEVEGVECRKGGGFVVLSVDFYWFT